MKIAVLSTQDQNNLAEADTVIATRSVSSTLSELGHEVVFVPISLNLTEAYIALKQLRPELVFNMVEGLQGTDSLIALAPLMLEALKLPYTGCTSIAMGLTNAKILAKTFMDKLEIPTPYWVTDKIESEKATFNPGQYIIKPQTEHASRNITSKSVVTVKTLAELRELIKNVSTPEIPCFAEAFIDGREFNVTLIKIEDKLVIVPVEMTFLDWPEDKPKIVCWDAKWNDHTFEAQNTQRCFKFLEHEQSDPLLAYLNIYSRLCWDRFHLTGYARVDFRVGYPHNCQVLEVNVNPGLAPDSGFVAAMAHLGYSYKDTIKLIVNEALNRGLSYV